MLEWAGTFFLKGSRDGDTDVLHLHGAFDCDRELFESGWGKPSRLVYMLCITTFRRRIFGKVSHFHTRVL